MKYLLFTAICTPLMFGCITPREWSHDKHQEMMMSCRSMCKKTAVVSYEPATGDCSCASKRLKRLR